MKWKEFEHLTGHPVRLGSAITSALVVHGILNRVSSSGMSVELINAQSGHAAGKFRVEILTAEALIRFVADGESDWIHPCKMNLSLPDSYEMVQRREFPRAPMNLSVWVRPLGPEEWAEDLQSEPVPIGPPHGQTQDLSVGGMAFLCTQLLTPGQQTLLSLDLGEGHCIVGLLATVTRQGPGPAGTWFTACRFTNPSEEIQTALSSLIRSRLQVAPSRQAYGKVIQRSAVTN